MYICPENLIRWILKKQALYLANFCLYYHVQTVNVGENCWVSHKFIKLKIKGGGAMKTDVQK